MNNLFEFMGTMFVGPMVQNDMKKDGFCFRMDGGEWFYKKEYVKQWW